MSSPIRVLQIVPSLNQGSGVLQVAMNWHRNIDRSKVQFDYIHYIDPALSCEEEIERLGGKCCRLPYPSMIKPWIFINAANDFFKNHRYRTVHSHITHLNFFFYPLAKMYGTKNIIQHAHGTEWSDKKLNGIRNYLMMHSVWPLMTKKMACSDLAGKYWYGKNYEVINNAVDLQKFRYDEAVRAKMRREMGLENNFVIGHAGRFNLQKNHKFLIDIFVEVLKKEPSARLILAGSGPLQEETIKYAEGKGLSKYVSFLGVRPDMPQLFQAMDIMPMPSLYEGLPVCGIEAQASGLPCVFADTITKEVLLLESSSMIPLASSAEEWAAEILKSKGKKRLDGTAALQKAGFGINEIAGRMQELYLSLERQHG